MTWNIFDSDNDGVKTFKELSFVLRTLIYLFSGLYAVLNVDRFTDTQFIGVIAASFGASVFEVFIRKGIGEKGKEHSNTLYRDVPEGDS